MVTGFPQFQDTITSKKINGNQIYTNSIPLAFAHLTIIFTKDGRAADLLINQVNDKFCLLAQLPEEFLVGKRLSHFSRDFEEIYEKVIKHITSASIEFLPKRQEVFISSLKKWYEVYFDMLDKNQVSIMVDDCTLRKLSVKKVDQEKKTKSDFLANMSHEIRTPLNGILGFTEILRTQEEDCRKKNMLSYVEDCGNQLMKVINDIFNYSNIESGNIFKRESEFDPLEMILETVGYFEKAAKKKGLKLSVNVNNIKTNCLLGDYAKLNQVIVNVISNAIKFTDEGKIEVTASTQNKKGFTYLKMVVVDNGIGIENDRLETIFDEFKQLDHYLTKRIQGTGIGLTITKRIVDFLGGKIKVESKPKNGSTFVIEIPFKESSEKRINVIVEDQSETNVGHMEKVKILLAEDNEANQFLIKALTKSTDWELTVVDDGEQAVEAYKKDKFDLVLMDVQMPLMNGYDATKLIREIEIERGYRTPIIALTAFAMKSDKDQCINAGMDDYISKPFKRQQFMDAIDKALNSSK